MFIKFFWYISYTFISPREVSIPKRLWAQSREVKSIPDRNSRTSKVNMTHDMTNDTIKFPKLNSDNWFQLKVQAKAMCMKHECWEAVQGEVNPEEEVSPQVATSRVRMDNKAQSLIVSSVGDEFLDDLDECTSAREMWETLENACTSYDILQEILFFRELFRGEKQETETMQA